ncbi:MAG: hypothetical protein V7K32_23185 [Nostoc sp.]|uniref:hypothetical protein n=1 Tax=Nostoc sp. TaxID=1180 RepID=UPI002FFC58BA
MAEKNTPLINELLLQVALHPEFETWLEEGKIPTELLKKLKLRNKMRQTPLLNQS